MTTDYKDYIYTPPDMAVLHVEYARHIKANPGIQFGIPSVDKVVIPARPGNLIAFAGRPGMGKTSLMCRQARHAADSIKASGMAHKECVIYVTYEQPIEELEAYFAANEKYTASDYAWGRAEMADVEANARERPEMPIWSMGHSISRSGRKLPLLTPDLIGRAIKSIDQDYEGIVPTTVFIDYVQLIPMPGVFRSTKERVDEVLRALKNLAVEASIPIHVGVQASREVDKRKDKVPTMADCQDTSRIEQIVDKLYGLWRPWKTEKANHVFKRTDRNGKVTKVENSPELLILGMSKQRMEEGSYRWMLRFTPQELHLADMEIGYEEPPQLNF